MTSSARPANGCSASSTLVGVEWLAPVRRDQSGAQRMVTRDDRVADHLGDIAVFLVSSHCSPVQHWGPLRRRRASSGCSEPVTGQPGPGRATDERRVHQRPAVAPEARRAEFGGPDPSAGWTLGNNNLPRCITAITTTFLSGDQPGRRPAAGQSARRLSRPTAPAERYHRLPQGSLALASAGGRRRLLIPGTLLARRRAAAHV
jgi:hypothetical protein